jgi:hypothetical protein
LNKVGLVLTLILVIVLLSCPLVTAAPLKDKSNDNFQTFHVTFTCNALTWVGGTHEYYPSFEKANRVTISGSETMLTYDITVGTETYHLGTDFIYTGHFQYVFFDVTQWNNYGSYGIWPKTGYFRERQLTVDYSYEFLPASELDGTIYFRAVAVEGHYGMMIASLYGTGDFEDVQIRATNGGEGNVGPIYTVYHDGWVIGWPE